MKVKTKASGAKLSSAGRTAAKKATTTKAKVTPKAKAKSNGSERVRHDDDALRPKVAAGLAKGETVALVAQKLGIASGKAAYLNMLNQVEDGEVPAISTAGGDDKTAARIVAAREKQDQYSSWGWISARVGIAEGRVKAMAEETGFEVKGSQIAKERAATRNGEDKPAAKKATAKGKAKPAVKAKRGPGRPKKEAADPSS